MGTTRLSPATPQSTSPAKRRLSPPLHILAALTTGALLVWFARSGLFVYFTGDDTMNLYLAWRKPYSQILLQNIFYFTPGYRPMGTLIYRLLFDIAGTNPFPFRITCFILMIGNLYFLYRTAAAIATTEVGLLAALLASYNAGFIDLYYNTGTIYDLLCFGFYFSALQLYVNVRKKDRFLTSRILAAFLLLYVCALNSKEMAVTLPVIVCSYDLLFRRSGHERPTRKYLLSRWMPAVLSALVTVPFVLGKFAASSPLMGNDAYRIHLGLRTYFRALHHYLEIFIRPLDALNLAAFALIVVVLGVIAVWSRRSTLIFAWLFILITPLPVAFIGLRGGYAIYITTFGLAVFLAVSIIEFRNALARLAIGPCNSLALQTRRVLQFDTFVLCLLVLLVYYQSMPLSGAVSSDDNLIRSLVTQIGSVQPRIDSKWKVLFLDDPFPNDYAVLFALRLYYRAPDLVVDRIKMMSEKPDKNQIDSYDCIFSFDGPRLVRVKP